MIWLPLTVVVFFLVRFLASKIKSPLFNPLLVSLSIIIPILVVLDIPYDDYYEGNLVFQYLLQPAVVALAFPLYQQLPEIRANWKIILGACVVGSISSMLTSTIIAVGLGVDMELLASILGKSVTTAISMEISSAFGGVPAIAAILVLVAGLVGGLLAYPIYKWLNITHPIAKGLTMGNVSHALGTATCFEHSERDAAFSSLALVLCGVITSVFAPAVMSFAIWLSV